MMRACSFLLLAFVVSWAPTAPAGAAPGILVLGDSLSAAYGIPVDSGWVALLQQRLEAQGYPHRVINASVSGETTAGGLARLPAALERHQPGFVLIELGGNDGLRALPLAKLKENLSRMVALSRQAGAQVILFEMRIPPNYGAYAEDFARSFVEVAAEKEVPIVPFLLGSIVTEEGTFQADGIHPTREVQARLLEVVWPVLEPLLRKQDG